jgi:hypothetical protein
MENYGRAEFQPAPAAPIEVIRINIQRVARRWTAARIRRVWCPHDFVHRLAEDILRKQPGRLEAAPIMGMVQESR